MAKLKDVATLAGVSLSTASKALNNYPGINEETREKVQAAAKELNYSPNPNAKQMVTGKSHILGILTADSSDNGLMHPFFGVVIETFRKYVNKQGYDVIIIPSNKEDMNMTYVEYCRYRMLDGVYVLRYSDLDDNLLELLNSDIPLITTDVIHPDVSIVSSEDINAAYDAYNYLHSIGHRDIFHLSGPQDTIAGQKRLRGFNEAQHIFTKGKPVSDYNYEIVDQFNYESGYEATLKMLARREDNIPDAIIAASDTVALGAISALIDKGYSIPDDVSILGFDNIELARYARPALTTMAQDTEKIGSITGDLLIRKIAGQKVAKSSFVPMHLVERNSVKKK